MSNRRWLARLLGCAACSTLVSCALLSKAAPLQPRYFSLEDGPVSSGRRAETPASAPSAMQLRLGRVSAGPHLRERMVYRDSEHELGYYEDRRWTERPETYLRRALARTLFEERGLLRVVSGMAPTLEVELVAFEEIRAPAHKVRMQVIITLDDDRVGYLEQTITAEQDLPSDDSGAAVATALSATLRQGVAQIADLVTAKLSTLPNPPPSAPPCVPNS